MYSILNFTQSNFHMNKNPITKLLLISGLLGSIVVGIGEYLLHFVPNGPDGEISMLFDVPLKRASLGHFIAVAGIPLYFSGYYGLKEFFKKTHKSLSVLLLIAGVLSFIIGGIWVASRYFAAEVFQRSAGTPDFEFYLNSYEDHIQILVWVLRIMVAAVSVIYVILVIKNKEGMPKWLAIFNPIVVLGLVISSLFWAKPIGVHIAPIAMNVTHFIFYGIVYIQCLKK